jgi:hypothetical protein
MTRPASVAPAGSEEALACYNKHQPKSILARPSNDAVPSHRHVVIAAERLLNCVTAMEVIDGNGAQRVALSAARATA